MHGIDSDRRAGQRKRASKVWTAGISLDLSSLPFAELRRLKPADGRESAPLTGNSSRTRFYVSGLPNYLRLRRTINPRQTEVYRVALQCCTTSQYDGSDAVSVNDRIRGRLARLARLAGPVAVVRASRCGSMVSYTFCRL
jgi:hypothetical protein